MSIVSEPISNEARDAAFAQTRVWRYVRITRTVPLCPTHKRPMTYYSGGPGRTRYYKCPIGGCEHTGTGQTSRENL